MIANRPDILLLDEPTAGIGADETQELAKVLTELHCSSGATFVMIEHDVELIARLSDRLVCMELGRVIADGSPQAVLRQPAVLEAYLGRGFDDGTDNAARPSSNGARRRLTGRLSAAERSPVASRPSTAKEST